ncbi:hypothetical protein QYM36_007992 [Artemia franciscana]|uniref:BTB domain-containing protein n=1 Tax=Artemia franciscana TaxID=6661 RepID=A0AA88IER6_ARTSF|nr:hypothetical protein QYM36_007992 [Artemia franciscana]
MLRETMSDSQQYCLKWNNYTDNVLSAFELLRNQEDFVDVTLSCDGKQVKAHKVVLSACSSYFQKILKENPCQHPIIILKDVPIIDLKSLVHFMYHGQVMVEQERIPRLLNTAQVLQVRGLCDVRSVHNLNGTASETVMNVLQAATGANPLHPVMPPKQIITTAKKNNKVPAPRPVPMLQSIVSSDQPKQIVAGATILGSQIVSSVPLLALAQAAASATPLTDTGIASSDTLSEDAEYNEKRPVAKKRKKSYESYPPPTPASTTTCIDDTENDYLDKDGDTDSDAALVIKEEPDVNFNEDSKKGYESDTENDGESGNEGSLSGNDRPRIISLLPEQLLSKGMLSAAAKLQAVANQAKGGW